MRPFKALQELQEGRCFRHFVSDLRWFLEDEPKLAGGLETGFGVQVHPGLDHRWHSEVCEQDSTNTGDALPKEALDYQAAAHQVERRREEESSPGARCLHDIAEKTHRRLNRPPMPMQFGEVNELHRPVSTQL